MTLYAVHTTDTGQLASVGTVVADPLPQGLTATALSAGDGRALRDGTGTWDAATRSVIPAPVDPAVANLATIESRVATLVTALRKVKDGTTTLTAVQRDQLLSSALLDTMRVLHNRLDATD